MFKNYSKSKMPQCLDNFVIEVHKKQEKIDTKEMIKKRFSKLKTRRVNFAYFLRKL